MSSTFYNEILTEHNIRPFHKHPMEGANFQLEGVNPSCGDDIILSRKVNDDGVIEDGAYVGDGCAISQASADMMLDLVIGKTKDQARRLADIFLRMIKGEASVLQDVSHMPARVKCAVLGWHTMEEILNGKNDMEA